MNAPQQPPHDPGIYIGRRKGPCPSHGHSGCSCMFEGRLYSELEAMDDKDLAALILAFSDGNPSLGELLARRLLARCS